jgi:hypothetical protein
MSTQDDIARDEQRHFAWTDRQVWCVMCDERIRELAPHEKPPINPWCRGCSEGAIEDVDAEAEEAWDEAWVALYNAAQEEDRFRRIKAERGEELR